MLQRLFLVIFSMTMSLAGFTQTDYVVSKDPKDSTVLVFKGILSDAVLQNESSFKWYKSGLDSYSPSPDHINLLLQSDSTLHFVVFGGTWCDDTQFILPRFMKWLLTAEFPNTSLTLLGVDRDKKTTGNLSAAFQITRVPTIIVFKNGNEVGRVVEYGKTGVWDKELAGFIR
jgi:thiol-disulfide isomerase/thioredoxin